MASRYRQTTDRQTGESGENGGSACVDLFDDDIVSLMQFLVGSTARIRVLSAVAAEAHSETALADATGDPQATVHQNLKKLADRDLVSQQAGVYRATWRGQMVLEPLREFGEYVATLDELEPFLKHVSTADLDLLALQGATVTTSEPNRPGATIKRTRELLRDSETIRLLTPYLVPRLVEAAAEHIDRDGTLLEVVSEESAVQALATDYPPAIRDRLASNGATIRAHDGDVSYAVGLLDDRVVLLSFDETGIPRALVETDNDRAQTWARTRYERYRDAGRPVRLDDDPDETE